MKGDLHTHTTFSDGADTPEEMIERAKELHYGFKNAQGQWINPLSKTMIATPKLSGERLARLKEQVKDIRKEIDLTLAAPAVKVNDSTDVMVRTRVLN